MNQKFLGCLRLDHLKDHPRARRVLETVAQKAGWGRTPKKGQGLGLAYHFSFGTHVAQVAEVSVSDEDGRIKGYRMGLIQKGYDKKPYPDITWLG